LRAAASSASTTADGSPTLYNVILIVVTSGSTDALRTSFTTVDSNESNG